MTERAKQCQFNKMLDTLISNKTRLKLLLRFFLNEESRSYLRGLEGEFNESTNAIRIELNRFEDAGLLLSGMEGNRKIFRANTLHPLYDDINSILRKYVGLDKIVENVVRKFGHLKKAYITGEMAIGIDNKIIELVLVGDDIDHIYLKKCIKKAEKIISRSIIFLILGEEQERDYLRQRKDAFLIWKNSENP